MTASNGELEEMLRDAHRLSGVAHYAALDAVYRHADAAGNIAFGYRARRNSLSELHHNGEYARFFLAFSWCLATFDRHPELIGNWRKDDLLWEFKWVVWELAQFPGIPLDRTYSLLDDMQRRYQLGGHSLHAVYQHRGLVAQHLGDLAAAGHWYEQMVTARRDSLSDCAACVPSGHVAHLVSVGRYEEAVTMGAPYSRGGCTEQPHWMLSELLLAYLHTDRLAEAANAHRTAYQRIRDSRHHLELIGLNLQFCGLTGNERYALGLIERHLPWLDRPSSPFAALEFSSAAALVLRRLVDGGAAAESVRRRSDDGTRQWTSTVAQTHAELVDLARSLAGQFDARNGNGYQSDRIEQRMAAQPLVEHLPLTVLAGRPIEAHPAQATVAALVSQVAELAGNGDLAGAARVRLELSYALRNAGQWTDALETAEEARRSLDACGLVEDGLSARHLLLELYRRAGAGSQVLSLLEELLAAPNLPSSMPSRARLMEQAANGLGRGDGVPVLLRAADEYQREADLDGEVRMLLRALRSMPPDADGWPLLRDRVDLLVAADRIPANDLDALQDQLCQAELRRGAGPDARARAQRFAGAGPYTTIRLAELLLDDGTLDQAELLARTVLAEKPVKWRAIRVVVAALRRSGREAAAADLAEQHGFDEVDDDEYELDDE